MTNVTKTELNQQTARVLARVAAGETLTITDRGRPIAQITPPKIDDWAHLVASGRVTMPTRRGPLAAPTAHSSTPSREILDDLRADRV